MVKEVVRDDSPKTIKCLQFGILSPQEIIALSEYEASDNSLYLAGTTERTPAPRGVLDRRLVSLLRPWTQQR
jgi:DNA-directed RNA polymerase III subunit RPC1